MYQLNNQAKWDTEYLHELMDGRIRSSDKAKKIREELMNQGALPQLDNHFDWAMLCIGYCFIKGWANQPHSLIKDGLDNRGVEIPSFKTCFQDYSRLWLVMLCLKPILIKNLLKKICMNISDCYGIQVRLS